MASPFVRINNAHLLDPFFKEHFADHFKRGHYPLPGEIALATERYAEAWRKSGDLIVSSLQQILALEFLRPILDVYIVGWIRPNISSPIVISSDFDSDRFVDILSHELIHVLLTDNKQNVLTGRVLAVMFPNEQDWVVRVHILIHAVLKALWCDYLTDDARLKRELAATSSRDEYDKAWKVVNSQAHQEIIAEFVKGCKTGAAA